MGLAGHVVQMVYSYLLVLQPLGLCAGLEVIYIFFFPVSGLRFGEEALSHELDALGVYFARYPYVVFVPSCPGRDEVPACLSLDSVAVRYTTYLAQRENWSQVGR